MFSISSDENLDPNEVATFPYNKIIDSIPDDHCEQMTHEKFLEELFNKYDKKIFIDLGCGDCNFYKVIKEFFPDFSYIGVDIMDSPESKVPKVVECEFIPYNGVNLPFQDKSVDIIYMKQVLEHVRMPHLLLPEIRRVLKDDGICCGSVSQLEPLHANSIFNWTYYGLASFFDLFNLKIYKLRPGIDSIGLITRHLNFYTLKRNHEFEDLAFKPESSLNYELTKWGDMRRMSIKEKNLLKLTYSGHVFFAATKLEKFFSDTKFNSADYWENRYKKGGNSGAGSYGRLGAFKAEVINKFIESHHINNVIEFGCGDGNQLKLYNFSNYIGYDVSPTIIKRLERENLNPNYDFKLTNGYNGEKADLVLSIDVLFHLIEPDIFYSYLRMLFCASLKYVIIYAPNNKYTENYGQHIKVRDFTNFVNSEIKDFKLIKFIPNKYTWDPKDPKNTSFCNFYIYSRI